ncbi:MAG: MFS transporter [Hyphomicrobiales bacterium]|jgi:MFS family permease|nr:MFS transporter [Hyphomicrobiales bacterium]
MNKLSPLHIKMICAGLILAIAVGIRQSFGLFLEPVSTSLNLGRETFALSIGLVNLLWGALAPFTGALSDKYGLKKVVIFGTLTYALGILILSNADQGMSLIIGGVIVGMGLSGMGFTVILGAVGKFAPPEKRGTALGLTTMGGSIGMFLGIPVSGSLIQATGWSSAFFWLAIISLLIIPLVYGLVSKKINTNENNTRIESDESLKEVLNQALNSRHFILLVCGFFICGFHVNFIVAHLPAYISDMSLPKDVSTTALALVGFANIFGVAIAGRLGDKFAKSDVLVVLYSLRAIVFIIYIITPISIASTLIFTFTLGLLWLGTVPLTSGLVATFFGPKYMSMLYGIVFFGHQLGGFFSAWIGGKIYDFTGNYDIMWWFSVLLGIFAAFLHYPIKDKEIVIFGTK